MTALEVRGVGGALSFQDVRHQGAQPCRLDRLVQQVETRLPDELHHIRATVRGNNKAWDVNACGRVHVRNGGNPCNAIIQVVVGDQKVGCSCTGSELADGGGSAGRRDDPAAPRLEQLTHARTNGLLVFDDAHEHPGKSFRGDWLSRLATLRRIPPTPQGQVDREDGASADFRAHTDRVIENPCDALDDRESETETALTPLLPTGVA